MDKIEKIINNILLDLENNKIYTESNIEFRKLIYSFFQKMPWVIDIEGYKRTSFDPIKFTYFENITYDKKNDIEYSLENQNSPFILEFKNEKLTKFTVNSKAQEYIKNSKLKIKILGGQNNDEDEDDIIYKELAEKTKSFNKPLLLNLILSNMPLVIEIADDIQINGNCTIDINLDLISKKSNLQRALYPLIIIKVGKNSKVNIIKNVYSTDCNKYLSDNECLVNEGLFIMSEDNSVVNFSNNYKNVNTLFLNNYEYLNKNSDITNYEILENVIFSKIEHISYISENVNSKFMGLIKAIQKNHIDIKTNQIHKDGNSKSFANYRTSCKDESYVIHQGLIEILENASGVDASLLTKALLLSKDSKVSLIPKLQINNNDVKCSHGATVANLADSEIQYLLSRGFIKDMAIDIILNCFNLEIENAKNKTFDIELEDDLFI